MTTRPRIEVYPTDTFTRDGTMIFHNRGTFWHILGDPTGWNVGSKMVPTTDITPGTAKTIAELCGYEWVELPDPAAKPPDPPVFVATHCVVSKYEKIAIAWGSEADCLAYIGKSSHITVRPFQIGAKP